MTGVRYGISDLGTGAREEWLCGGSGFGAWEAGRNASKGVGAFGGVAFVYITEWPGLHRKCSEEGLTTKEKLVNVLWWLWD